MYSIQISSPVPLPEIVPGFGTLEPVDADSINLLMKNLATINLAGRIALYKHFAVLYNTSTWLEPESEPHRNMVTAIQVILEQILELLPQLVIQEIKLILVSIGRCPFTNALFHEVKPMLMLALQKYNIFEAAEALVLGRLLRRPQQEGIDAEAFDLLCTKAFNYSARFPIGADCLDLVSVYWTLLTIEERDAIKPKQFLKNLAQVMPLTTYNIKIVRVFIIAIQYSLRQYPEAISDFTEVLKELTRQSYCYSDIKADLKFWRSSNKTRYAEKVYQFKEEEVLIDSIARRIMFTMFNTILGEQFEPMLAESQMLRAYLKPQPKSPTMVDRIRKFFSKKDPEDGPNDNNDHPQEMQQF